MRTLFPRAAETNRARAGLVDLPDLVRRIQDLAAGRKVRPLDVPHNCTALRSGLSRRLHERGADLAEVVRRNVGGHADGDAGGAVDQEVRDPRRQDHRFGACAVVVWTERHRGLVDLAEHLVAEAREPALRVAHRRRRVAVERSEVAGTIDERITKGKWLRHAHERLVQRRVPCGW